MLFERYAPHTLLQGASVLAACAMATSGEGWAQGEAQNTGLGVLEDLVVARWAIKSAREPKKHTEGMVRSVVGDDAGKRSNSSAMRILRRLGGVAIVRVSALADPDGFSAKGGEGLE